MVRWVVGSILHGVDPLGCFSFQPVLHDWCNKGRGICYPVCWMVHIKLPLLLIGKSSLCGGSGFPFSLTICPTPYNCKQNVLSASLNKTFPSFLFRGRWRWVVTVYTAVGIIIVVVAVAVIIMYSCFIVCVSDLRLFCLHSWWLAICCFDKLSFWLTFPFTLLSLSPSLSLYFCYYHH